MGPSDDRWGDWRAGVAGLTTAVDDRERAITDLERTYLDGKPVRFPDTLARWERLREAVDDLAAVGSAPTVTARFSEPDSEGMSAETRRLVESAQARALDILGDRVAATDIIGRRFTAGSNESAIAPGEGSAIDGGPR